MPINPELSRRIFAFASPALLKPLLNDGPDRPLRQRLQADFVEQVVVVGPGDKHNRAISAGRDAADAVRSLIRVQLPSTDIGVDIFAGRDAGPSIQAFQGDALAAIFLATTLLASDSKKFGAPELDGIIRIATSVSPAGVMMRDVLLDPRRQPAPRDPPRGIPGVPGVPGIPPDLLKEAERIRQQGCGAAVAKAMGQWGRTIRAWTPRYIDDAIGEIKPQDGCAGEELRISGRGFGNSSADRTVVFTADGGRMVGTPAANILEWKDTLIRLIIPAGAIRGPIGIIVDAPGAEQTPAQAAAAVLADVQACFGPAALGQMQTTLDRFKIPPVFPPVAQANGANLFAGGPPVIDYFTVLPSRTLSPDCTIQLSWKVIGATAIEIVARDVPGSAQQELPAKPGPLPFPVGSVSLAVPGTRAWKGQYVLRAFNRCTGRDNPREHPIDLEMVFRKGLALGGGGSRGDFQAGALNYLYNVKGYRPDAIAGTSVGAINAVELAMGDDAAGNAVNRLLAWWSGLADETSMWAEEPWLAALKPAARKLLRSISIEGVLALPYTAIADGLLIADIIAAWNGAGPRGPLAIFNLSPIENLMNAAFGGNGQARINKAGIKVRLIAVSLETGELVMMTETGGVLALGPAPSRPPAVPPAAPSATPFIDGAIASATMPCVFPARRLGDHMCVDGGVKEVIPVQVAVNDLGCNQVFALRCSAKTETQPTDPGRNAAEILARSVLALTFDEVGDDDVMPVRGWGDGVKVVEIRPGFDLHDPMVIEPGLIRIAMDYGWMRAADMLDVKEEYRGYAMEMSDRITTLRALNWRLTHWAAGAKFLDPHRSFTDFLLANAVPNGDPELQLVPTPEAVDDVRANCLAIRDALLQRTYVNAPVPASRNNWFTQWEVTDTPPQSNTPWDLFVSRAGNRPAAQPPPAI
jgi:predicted acylesterase/phospholipase RssA